MKLENVRIVLVGTTHPGNIGATARAMKTMGLSSLYLVNPKKFPDQNAYEMSAGAEDILHQSTVVSSLDEALQNCHLVLGTSARPRDLFLPGFTPAQAAHYLKDKTDDATIALVFGREHAGLTNEELLKCQYHIQIPSNPEYSSLNLAQAVQIIAYEIRMQFLLPMSQVNTNETALATHAEVEHLFDHLQHVLTEIDFLKPSNNKKLPLRIRRMLNRIGLEQVEVNILRGILSQMQMALRKNEKQNEQ